MSKIYTEGVERIYAEDFQSQSHYLSVLAENVRNSSVEELFKFKCFFVPNDKYLSDMFGVEIMKPEYDMYDYEGLCKWHGCIMIPVYNIVWDIVGFVGYDALTRLETLDSVSRGLVYKYSALKVFKRSDYIHVRPDIYKKALKDKYIFTLDGTFDMIYAVAAGLNACSLFGSYVNDKTIFQLKFMDRVYVPVDNDAAGEMLLSKLRAKLGRKVIAVKQNKTKDLDDILKSKFSEDYLHTIREHISGGYKQDLYNKL